MALFGWIPFCVIWTFSLPVAAGGHEACYEDSWTYDSHTHSCFRIFDTYRRWPDARDDCGAIQLGSSFGVITRLAKIDDSTTNDFIRSLFPASTWVLWIGLHNSTSSGEFRWDGYPDEMPKFTDPNWQQASEPYVTIENSRWNGLNANYQAHSVCQHKAKAIGVVTCQQDIHLDGVSITCTSENSPRKARCQWTYKYEVDFRFQPWSQISDPIYMSPTGGDNTFQTTCSATLTIDNTKMRDGTLSLKMKMYPDLNVTDISTNGNAFSIGSLDIAIVRPRTATFTLYGMDVRGRNGVVIQGSESVILSCGFRTASPVVHSTLMACDAPIANEVTTSNEAPEAYSVTIRQINRDMNGQMCTCWAYHLSGRTENFTLTFNVVSKPTDVTCDSSLSQDGVFVGCQTDKVYPIARCLVSYRQETDLNFNTAPSSQVMYVQQSFRANDGLIYYVSRCSLTLTSDVMTFRPGLLMVQVKLLPSVEGIDEITANDTLFTTQDSVQIDLELPDQPQIRMRGGRTLSSSSMVLCVEGDEIDLTCEVNSGKPPVKSVTVSCEFPLNDPNEGHERMLDGTDGAVNLLVSHDMRGKSCTCIGNHLTGPIRSSPLTVVIVAKPSDVTCSINLHSYALFVSCEIGKVFPEASCQWSYLNEGDRDPKSVPDTQSNAYYHEPYTDVDGFVYYRSSCSVTLTPDITTFREGLFSVKVTMHASLDTNISNRTTNETVIRTQDVVKSCNYLNCLYFATIDLFLGPGVLQVLKPSINLV